MWWRSGVRVSFCSSFSTGQPPGQEQLLACLTAQETEALTGVQSGLVTDSTSVL